jgi:hypothetical protein
MTSLEFVATTRCMLCGRRLAGLLVGSFRVNKKTIRSVGTHLSWGEPSCRECGFPAPAEVALTLSAESAALVEQMRARRGWVAA